MSRPAAEAVPHGGVRAQAVLRDVAVLRVRPPVGGEGVREQEPARPDAELAAGDHVPADPEEQGGVRAGGAVGGAARPVRRGARAARAGGAQLPRRRARRAAAAAAAGRRQRHQPPALQQGHTLQAHNVPVVQVMGCGAGAGRRVTSRRHTPRYQRTMQPHTHTLTHTRARARHPHTPTTHPTHRLHNSKSFISRIKQYRDFYVFVI